MPQIVPFLVGLMLASAPLASRGVETIPELEQAARATQIIDAYHGPRPADAPKKLQVVYFTPADRDPAARYEERLEPILEDIRAFYRDGMQRWGFGSKTFTLPRDGRGRLIIRLVKGKQPAADFPRWQGRNGGNTGDPVGGDMVKSDCAPVLKTAGLSFDHETVLVFCHLATYDETAGTFRHHSPYFGSWSQASGLCFAADWSNQDLANLTKKSPMLKDGEYGNMSIGKHTTIFLGGIAHELGHAFALPHCGERWDEKSSGTSLLGAGNHTYREERRGEGAGSFLTMASAMRLAARPLFNGSAKGEMEPGRLKECRLNLSTQVARTELAGRPGALRLEGSVEGSPPIYAVVAYFDSVHDGGYRAPAATSVPDADGKFAIEVSDLEQCATGELRVEFCHVNGAVSERRLGFSVTPRGQVDLSQWEMRRSLEPVARAVADDQLDAAKTALAELLTSDLPAATKDIARKLVATLDPEPRPSPADISAQITKFPLGDAAAQSADVGWLKPAANRIPPNDEIPSPLLDCGRVYATGLYAHAPSHYAYQLGGKWRTLRGEAGLHTAHQGHGAVIFIIKADGKEVFRSKIIRETARAKYEVDVAQVKTLELIVEKAFQSNGGNWALWLEPTLVREAGTDTGDYP